MTHSGGERLKLCQVGTYCRNEPGSAHSKRAAQRFPVTSPSHPDPLGDLRLQVGCDFERGVTRRFPSPPVSFGGSGPDFRRFQVPREPPARIVEPVSVSVSAAVPLDPLIFPPNPLSSKRRDLPRCGRRLESRWTSCGCFGDFPGISFKNQRRNLSTAFAWLERISPYRPASRASRISSRVIQSSSALASSAWAAAWALVSRSKPAGSRV